MAEYGEVEDIVLAAIRQWFTDHRAEFPDADGGDVVGLGWEVMSALTRRSTLPISLTNGVYERSGRLSEWDPNGTVEKRS